jgi:hypothetical protein
MEPPQLQSSTKAFAIVNELLGALGAVSAVRSVPYLLRQGLGLGIAMDVHFLHHALAQHLLGLPFFILAIVSGIGLQNRKRWAPRLAIAYGAYAFLAGAVGLAVQVVILRGGFLPEEPDVVPILGLTMLWGIAGLVYHAFLIRHMRRPEVTKACVR